MNSTPPEENYMRKIAPNTNIVKYLFIESKYCQRTLHDNLREGFFSYPK